MSLTPEIIDKVRQSVDIVEVIGSYVTLKRAGTYYKGLSPFNKEKTPSFMVHPARQSFKCYSSGHGGDVFKFLMVHENLSFPEAVRRLAERAGIVIPESRQSPDEARVAKDKKERFLNLHFRLARHWSVLLKEDGSGAYAREYLEGRNIPLEWADEYGLGYAPGAWDGSIVWGKKNGFSEDDLVESGVCVRNENGRVYDRFRDRLVFSIYDDTGRIVAFSAREIRGEADTPKYINSPETILFKKSRTLFGLDRAKRAILDADEVIVCEGQIDVLRCHSTGINHVVAPLGTAFTDEHCRVLKRLTQNLVLCLDADRAGLDTAERLGSMLLKEEDGDGAKMMARMDLGVRVMRLPAGDDPDSLIVREGAEAFRNFVKEAEDYLSFYIAHITGKQARPDSPTARKAVIESVAGLIAHVESMAVRDALIEQAAARVKMSGVAVREAVEGARRKRASRSTPTREEKVGEEAILVKVEENVDWHPLVRDCLLILLARPEMEPELRRRLNPLWLVDCAGVEMLLELFEMHEHEEWQGISAYLSGRSDMVQNHLAGLDLDGLGLVGHGELVEQLDKLARNAEIQWINGRLDSLSQKIRAGNVSDGELESILQEQMGLQKRKSHLTTARKSG